MPRRQVAARALLAAALGLFAGTTSAAVVAWTDWTSVASRSASGAMGGVGVSLSSAADLNTFYSQTGCGINRWTQPDPLHLPYTGGTISNAPAPCEQIALYSPNTLTVTFSSPVDRLYMALLSVGSPSVPVTYDFDRSFTIDSEGRGNWGIDLSGGVIGAGDALTGREFNGVLLFSAPVQVLRFSTNRLENYSAFTFGTPIPEPGTLALLGLGIAGLAATRRRKR